MNIRGYNILILVLLIFILIIGLLIIYNNTEEYYDINNIDNDILSEDTCKQWFINRTKFPIINPISGHVILKNKVTFKDINKKCKKYEKINKKYKNIESVPDYLKVLYAMLFNGYVKLITNIPSEKYNRSMFGKWTQDYKCDIRSKVLYRENTGNLVFNPSKCDLTKDCDIQDYKCTIYSGKWTPISGNYFDNTNKITYEYSKLIDVDHTVPLQHAYYAGAYQWTSDIREKYSNDLTPGHLMTMVYYLNTEKGDKDPSEWLPPDNQLRYVSNWLSVKYRYGLIINPSEFNVIQNILEQYKDFRPDNSIDIKDVDIGYETMFKLNTTLDPYYSQERKIFLNKFNTTYYKDTKKSIQNECKNNKINISNRILNSFKEELKNDNNHAYFGLLRPEYIKLLKEPKDICNYIF